MPWQRRRRLLQEVTATFPCGQQLQKYGYRNADDDVFYLFLQKQKSAQHADGSVTPGARPRFRPPRRRDPTPRLPHPQQQDGEKIDVVRRRMSSEESAGKESCLGKLLATFKARGALDKGKWCVFITAGHSTKLFVVIDAHNACIRDLLQEVNAHRNADRHMRLLTIETESRLCTLWDQVECNQFCPKEELREATRDEEMKIPWHEGPPVPKEQHQERFWRRRLDGIGLDTATKVFLAIEFK
jgi:hypothetical protein